MIVKNGENKRKWKKTGDWLFAPAWRRERIYSGLLGNLTKLKNPVFRNSCNIGGKMFLDVGRLGRRAMQVVYALRIDDIRVDSFVPIF